MIKTREYRTTQAVAHIICIGFTLCALLPFALLIISSFTDNNWAQIYGFTFLPKQWSLDAYTYIVRKWDVIGKSYFMTLLVTALGTTISLVITTLFAYGISKSHIPGMKLISFLLVFTMLFNGGIVSTYYCYVKFLNIKDSIWSLIVPNLMMNAFNVILVRNYFVSSIPPSLEEAARVDGASSFGIFLRIVVPLSKPIIATIGLMTGLSYWNDWMNGLYYLTKRGGADYNTIQITLNNINDDIRALTAARSMNAGPAMNIEVPTVTIKMAIAVIGILPILVIYPFFQRYFVKSITLGGVKE